jgi:hypothetical protein
VSGQEGPVEQGAAPVVHMDLDRALAVLRQHADDHISWKDDHADALTALAALGALVDRARQFVAGPTSGRLAALAQVLQEPVPEHASSISAETIAQAYLAERGMVAVHREVLERLGIALPSAKDGG